MIPGPHIPLKRDWKTQRRRSRLEAASLVASNITMYEHCRGIILVFRNRRTALGIYIRRVWSLLARATVGLFAVEELRNIHHHTNYTHKPF